jgi:acyl carrier protein
MRIGEAVAICQKTGIPIMHPSKEEIATELKKILVDDLFVEIPTEKMKDTDSLSSDIGLDSVGQIELVSLIEERYGLKIDVKVAAAEMKTIGSTADYVWKNVHAARD